MHVSCCGSRVWIMWGVETPLFMITSPLVASLRVSQLRNKYSNSMGKNSKFCLAACITSGINDALKYSHSLIQLLNKGSPPVLADSTEAIQGGWSKHSWCLCPLEPSWAPARRLWFWGRGISVLPLPKPNTVCRHFTLVWKLKILARAVYFVGTWWPKVTI